VEKRELEEQLEGLRSKSEVAEVRSEELLLSIGRLEQEHAGLVEELVHEVNLRKSLEVNVEELERDLQVSVDSEMEARADLKLATEKLKRVRDILEGARTQRRNPEAIKRFFESLRQSRSQSSS
jgi:hypothetical protein